MLLVGLVALPSCQREPLPNLCPAVEPGELVISELRGDQDDSADSFGHYLEVYNASDHTVDLEGLRVRLRGIGGDELEVLVRESLELPAGDYAVLGPGTEGGQSFVDYFAAWDLCPDSGCSGGDVPGELFKTAYYAGFIELEACDELIDEVEYAGLPGTGTLACGNEASPPSANQNDDAEGGCWCVDAEEADPNFPLFGLGLPGTPGRTNRCP